MSFSFIELSGYNIQYKHGETCRKGDPQAGFTFTKIRIRKEVGAEGELGGGGGGGLALTPV